MLLIERVDSLQSLLPFRPPTEEVPRVVKMADAMAVAEALAVETVVEGEATAVEAVARVAA
jgi:hypothetical protein